MPPVPDYVLVVSGTVGAAGALSPSSSTYITRQYPIAIFVPSLSPASEVRIQFAQTSGGSAAGDVFADLFSVDGAGVRTAIYSGAGPGWGVVQYPPTPWARVALVASQTSVRTIGFYQVAVYT